MKLTKDYLRKMIVETLNTNENIQTSGESTVYTDNDLGELQKYAEVCIIQRDSRVVIVKWKGDIARTPYTYHALPNGIELRQRGTAVMETIPKYETLKEFIFQNTQ